MLAVYKIVINLLQHSEFVDYVWEWHPLNKSGICIGGDTSYVRKGIDENSAQLNVNIISELNSFVSSIRVWC